MRIYRAVNQSEAVCGGSHNSTDTDMAKISTSKSVFLCHSSHDKAFARRLRDDLRVFGVDAWLDETDLPPGVRLEQALKETIDRIGYVAVIVSYDMVRAESKWIEKELDFAFKRGAQLIPLFLDHIVAIPSHLKDKPPVNFLGRQDREYHRSFHELLARLEMDHDWNKDHIVYLDALSPGWEDWSWDCRTNPSATDFVHSGDYAYSAELRARGGVAFAFRTGIDCSHFHAIEVYLNGGRTGGQRLKIYVCDELRLGVRREVKLGYLKTKSWRRVIVPMKDLDAEEIVLFRINFVDISGADQGAFFLDDMRLVRFAK
jgi:hypothetical protein